VGRIGWQLTKTQTYQPRFSNIIITLAVCNALDNSSLVSDVSSHNFVILCPRLQRLAARSMLPQASKGKKK
jgi:hypothetical protein